MGLNKLFIVVHFYALQSKDITLIQKSYEDYPWRISYRTSSGICRGKPVNILHDFYIPVLRRSIRYDRVAGYFRSTSLAAASQGFSAFLENGGKARFIVGADLAREDVSAILSASQNLGSGTRNLESGTGDAYLEDALDKELDHMDKWPENVQNGVCLLGHLICKGILDIRVAFRVHAQTGNALGPDAVEDGYVHEKWGIFTDSSKNRIYISGSLNESRTALTLNAENIDVHCDWKGESARIRTDEAAEEFEILWNNQNPAFQVLTLPDAVRKQLVRISENVGRVIEIDGSGQQPLEIVRPSLSERLRFALIKDAPKLPGGRFVGMETAAITPWPHQDIVARRLIATWPLSYLLCDEVGLGKTVEAGLVIRSLYLSGIVKRALIVSPASLTEQWHREMAAKFLLPFARALGSPGTRHEFLMPCKTRKSSASLCSPDLNILSTGLFVRKERRKAFQHADAFDLILVDEAHCARQARPASRYRVRPRANKLFRTISEHLRPKAKCLLLATATPMQMHPAEVFDLIRFTCRAGAFQNDPGLANTYYDILSRLVRGESVSKQEWAFLRNAILDAKQHDPHYYQHLCDTVIDGRIRTAARRWLEQGRPPRGRHLKGMQRLIFSGSPLSRVMLRHTRSLLEIYQKKNQLDANLAKRIILPLPRIIFTEQEQVCYEQLEVYCKILTSQIIHNGNKKQQASLGFYLSFLRLRFASSLFAIRETLIRRQDRVRSTLNMLVSAHSPDPSAMSHDLANQENDAETIGQCLQNRNKADLEWEQGYLSAMVDALSDLSLTSSKMTALLGILDKRRIPGTERIRQTVIFTRFYDTLTDIVERLRRTSPNMHIGTFSGRGGQISDHRRFGHPGPFRLLSIDREAVKRGFLRNEIDILVCTDAAAEGLNLQTADMLINFDLPWNPMKVEQRIGRIDRIGQTHERIYVHNLCYAGSAEEIVYGRLLTRLARAGEIVGTQQVSLMPVTPEDFKYLAEGRLSQAELEKKAVKEAKRIRKQSQSRELPPEDVHNICSRLNRSALQGETCDSLGRIWKVLSESACLRDMGCRLFPDKGKKAIMLRNIPGVPDGTVLTASRITYEYGLTGSFPDTGPGTRETHLASYGDPVFDALLEHISGFGLPKCVRRLESDTSDNGVPMAGYAVAAYDQNDHRKPMLVTSLHDLEGLKIDESAELTPADMEPLQKKLTALAQAEFGHIRISEEIEILNHKAAVSQTLLNYLIIRSLLRIRQKFGMGEALFRVEAKRIEETYKDQDFQQIPDIDKDKAQKLHGILFDVQIPASGDKATIRAPGFLIMTALDAVCQLTHGMRRKKK